MSKQDHVHIGGATGLRYQKTTLRYQKPRAQKHHPGQGASARRPDPVHPPREPRAQKTPKLPRLTPRIVAAAAVVVLALVGAGVWHFQLRSVPITVNGEELEVRVGTPLADLMAEHEDFGCVPGRLISVGGNVISENEGNPCQVKRGEEVIDPATYADVRLGEGDMFTVENGADAEEPSHEDEQEVAPSITMDRGGAVQYVETWGKPGKKILKTGERSGETVEVETTEEPVDMHVACINLEPKGGKYVALTFDDGPSKYTADILKILKEKGAKATFFNLGQNAADRPDDVKAIVDAGMELASHTNTHQNLPKLGRDDLRAEISSAFDTLSAASGTKIQMMRAPYGAFTSVEWARAGDIISTNVLWNIDTLDWKRPGADAIAAAAVSGVKNGSIILMHDGGGNRSQDVEALPQIIDSLKADGYELVTVGELIELDGRIPEAVSKNEVALPEGAVMPTA